MNKRTGLLITLLAILAPLGCTKQATDPIPSMPEPPLTYVGSGLFGFSANGIDMTSNNGIPNQSSAAASCFLGNDTVTDIENEETAVGGNSCQIQLTWANPSGGCSIVYLTIFNVVLAPHEYAINSAEYDSNTIRNVGLSGLIKITKFDTINNLVSGLFRFYYSINNTFNAANVALVDSGYFNDVPIVNGSFGQGTVTATVDGQAFGMFSGSPTQLTASDSNNAIRVMATNGGDSLEIFINNPKADSTYNLATNNGRTYVEYINLPNSQSDTTYYAHESSLNGAGSLTITKLDTVARRLSATFNATVSDGLGNMSNITNGVINNVQWYVAN
jgi:hypothetical protein